MTKFVVGQPVVTTLPSVVVDAGLPIGTHNFQLQVVDSSGLKSAVAKATVKVQSPAVGGGVITNLPTGTTTTTGTTVTPVLSPTGTPAIKKTPKLAPSSIEKSATPKLKKPAQPVKPKVESPPAPRTRRKKKE